MAHYLFAANGGGGGGDIVYTCPKKEPENYIFDFSYIIPMLLYITLLRKKTYKMIKFLLFFLFSFKLFGKITDNRDRLFTFFNQNPYRFHRCFNRPFRVMAMGVAHSGFFALLIPHHIEDAPCPCAEDLADYIKG